MTLISQDAINRREAARDNGRFGEQTHTTPEFALAADRTATVEDLWQDRQAAARELEAAAVNEAIANMPENIKGLRFIVRDDKLTLALVIPSTPGGHIAGSDFHEQYRPVIEAYAQNRSDYIELEPTVERNGNDAWEWIPTPEQRAIPASFAETAREDALRRFRETDYAFNDEAAAYLRDAIPAGVDAIEVAYEPVNTGHGYITSPTVIGAYDADGELVPINIHHRDLTDYRVNVARTNIATWFPVRYNETGGAIYTITREAQA